MKRLLLLSITFFVFSSSAFCNNNEYIYDMGKTDNYIPVEEIAEDNTIYLDLQKYDKLPVDDKIFKLQIEHNKDFLNYEENSQHINIKTKYSDTIISKNKFNNKTTISGKTDFHSNRLSENLRFSTSAELKEFLPIYNESNYSMLSTNFGTKYKYKKLTFISEFTQDGNILTETIKNKVSVGQTLNLNKSSVIKSSISKNINEDNVYGELSLIFKPAKSKRNFSFEINAASGSSQYNIIQQRIQFYGKIQI